MSDARKTFIIGVDGATFEVLDRLLERGEVPHFARFIDGGVSGTLDSTLPPLSPPAWISAITGCQPSRHGVYHFHRYPGYPTNGHAVTLVTMKSVRVPTMWDWISGQGKHGICVNVPLTYPPQNLDNVAMLSGFPTPPSADDAIAPREVAEDFARSGLDYESNEPPLRDYTPAQLREKGLVDHVDAEEEKLRATLHLLKQRPWDVAMHVMTMTDRFQHFFWGEDDVLDRVYREIDRLLGVLLEELDEDTNIFLMSDHGFGPFLGDFNTSAFLRQKGYLKLQDKGRFGSYGMRVARPDLGRLLTRLRLRPIAKRLPAKLLAKVVPIPRPYWKGWQLVDWDQSKAYCSDFGIRLNVRGRQRRGIIEPGEEYEAVRTEIMDALRDLRHPDNGEPMITSVWRREEVHTGPLAEEAPDILFEVRGMEYVQSDRLGPLQMITPTRFTGTHRIPGVMLAMGPDIKPATKIQGAHITDLMPTALHAAGLPVPEGLDGKLLEECFTDLAERPPEYQPPLEHQGAGKAGKIGAGDQDALEQRLRQLGYL